MSTFQVWMSWVMGLMIVLDLICVYGYNKKKNKK